MVDVQHDSNDTVSNRKSAMDWTNYKVRSDQLSGEQKNVKNRMSNAVNQACYGRRLCWTQKVYAGVVPAASKITDKVCAFFGGQVLYVVREKETSLHEFVGECDIHGLMDGEVIQWVEEGQITPEIFRLA